MKFNKLIPELGVSDIGKSLEFYTKVLGFKIEYQREEPKFFFLSLQGAQLMIDEIDNDTSSPWCTAKAEHPFGRGMNIQIEVDEVDVLVKSLEKNGYPIKMMPKETWYRVCSELVGSREFMVMDPDGYLLRFAKGLGRKPVE